MSDIRSVIHSVVGEFPDGKWGMSGDAWLGHDSNGEAFLLVDELTDAILEALCERCG